MRMCKIAVWSKEIEEGEVASLAAGTKPTDIKARYLVGSWESAKDFESESPDDNLAFKVPINTSEDFPGIGPTVNLQADATVMEKRR